MRHGLGTKLAIPILVTLTAGFGLFLSFSIRQQTEHLNRQARERARAVSMVFGANLRNVMLTGDGVLLEGLLADIRRLNDMKAQPLFRELRLFDPHGREVHPATEGIVVTPEEQAEVSAALAGGRGETRHSQDPDGAWRHLSVLPNDPSCRPCHPTGSLRGALLLTTRGPRPAVSPAEQPDEGAAPARSLARSVALSIRNAMLSQRASSVPQILADLRGARGLGEVQVFAPDGRLRFGTVMSAPGSETAHAVQAALRSRREASWVGADAVGGYQGALTVLENDRLCHACHSPKDPLRGVVVAVTRPTRGGVADPELANALLAASLTAGVRNIMLSGKGAAVRRYLEAFRDLPGVERLHVFDPAAREVYPGARARRGATPGAVYTVLKGGREQSYEDRSRNALVQLQPLPNEEKCQRCHGSDHRFRGVIMSAVSLAGIQRDVGDSRSQSLLSFSLTMLLVCLVLLGFVAAAVVRPIRVIGGVADRVGEGDLDVRADVRSQDEIGLLAARINQMIGGLRAKLHMEKFVPPSAVALIERSSASDRLALGGERREVTVLFCDIRGFTTFSEQAEPEEVIRRVNTYLAEQARLVREHQGEVDKYLGDAMMAVFAGPTMARDAVRCALAIRDVIAARTLAETGRAEYSPGRAVGIGINTGPVVRGTVGSAERMEFTALGDAVNVAKRLCDVAAPGEVLISSATYAAVADEVVAEAGQPIPVKGRTQPVAAYRVLGSK